MFGSGHAAYGKIIPTGTMMDENTWLHPICRPVWCVAVGRSSLPMSTRAPRSASMSFQITGVGPWVFEWCSHHPPLKSDSGPHGIVSDLQGIIKHVLNVCCSVVHAGVVAIPPVHVTPFWPAHRA